MCSRAIETEELAVLQTISALSSWPVPRVAHPVVPQGGTRTPDRPSRKALRMLYNYPLFPRQSPRARGLDSSPALCPSRHLLSHQTPTLSGEVGAIRPKRCSQVPLTFSRGTPGSPSCSAPATPFKTTSSRGPRPHFPQGHTTLQIPDIPALISRDCGLRCPQRILISRTTWPESCCRKIAVAQTRGAEGLQQGSDREE